MGSTKMIDVLRELKFPLSTTGFRNRLSMPKNVPFRSFGAITTDEDAWRLLSVACWYQDLRLVKHLLGTCSALQDPIEMVTNGSDALCVAVYRENEDIASVLLERGADINQRVFYDKSALTTAIAVDWVRMLRFLMERGADISGIYHDGIARCNGSLLPLSVHLGAIKCAHELLPLETRSKQLDEALVAATKHGYLDLLQLLLDRALPSTENAFVKCVSSCESEIMLDLLFSRCCAERYPISLVYKTFARQYVRFRKADSLSVFLAHGLDIMSNPVPTRQATTSRRS